MSKKSTLSLGSLLGGVILETETSTRGLVPASPEECAMDHLEVLLLTAAAVHLIGDFPFQSDFLANFKGKSWEILVYHCLVYTATFVLASQLPIGMTVNPWAFLVLFVTHMIIDACKARQSWKEEKSMMNWATFQQIYVDQFFHVAVIVVLAFVGWIS